MLFWWLVTSTSQAGVFLIPCCTSYSTKCQAMGRNTVTSRLPSHQAGQADQITRRRWGVVLKVQKVQVSHWSSVPLHNSTTDGFWGTETLYSSLSHSQVQLPDKSDRLTARSSGTVHGGKIGFMWLVCLLLEYATVLVLMFLKYDICVSKAGQRC